MHEIDNNKFQKKTLTADALCAVVMARVQESRAWAGPGFGTLSPGGPDHKNSPYFGIRKPR